MTNGYVIPVPFNESNSAIKHDDVIKWKHFPRNWPFVREIHRSPVNFPHKGQWRGALMFSLIYAWINDWVNNREAGDLRRQHGHYDVIVMNCSTHDGAKCQCQSHYDRFGDTMRNVVLLWFDAILSIRKFYWQQHSRLGVTPAQIEITTGSMSIRHWFLGRTPSLVSNENVVTFNLKMCKTGYVFHCFADAKISDRYSIHVDQVPLLSGIVQKWVRIYC